MLKDEFEKLGQFYLGREYDQANRQSTDNLLLYDSRDLTTHAVVLGMTGSGKTGLCIDLLEEAAMDNIPSIVIDPKGDISNLLLTFPNLTPEEFRPWIDEGQAARKGVTPEVFATHEAEKWKQGLAAWGQSADRIRTLREKVEMRIYTPGSSAGRPLTVLQSFSAPGPDVLNDADAFQDRISAATSGLLALLGIEADPINSREHILIAKVLEHNWRKKINLNLGKLIKHVQDPPFARVGIMELDDFCSKKDRRALALTLNNLLASPAFASWMEGEPLNIKDMLHTADAKPCVSILSISHLSDAERMFFVTTVLNEMIAWMRAQAGTSSLRAILYMDEVAGYFPPTKNPPSKPPMLTLLKQARAYGLGCVLATQNPVDVDYKGLSNAGTWFLGRLQTERDKLRVLEGLEGASTTAGASFDRDAMEKTLAGLNSRIFLMNNVHEDQPVVFETRWAMSYLRGPLSRNQLHQLILKDPNFDPSSTKEPQTESPQPKAESVVTVEPSADQRELLPASVQQNFVDPAVEIGPEERVVYRPALFGRGRMHHARVSYHVDQWSEISLLAKLIGSELPDEIWQDAQQLESPLDLGKTPEGPIEFSKIPVEMQSSKNYTQWKKEFKEFLYRTQVITIWRCEELKKYSQPGQTLGEFKVDLEQLASELRDEKKDALRKRFGKRFATLRSQIRRAEDKIEVEKSQYKQSRLSSYLSIGTTVMGAILGRRSTRSAASSAKSYGRSSKEKDDIDRAKGNLNELMAKFETLEREFNAEVDGLDDKLDVNNLEYSERKLSPRKTDLSVEEFGVCWIPWSIDATGIAQPII